MTERALSVCITGTSAAGKSLVVEEILKTGTPTHRFGRPVTATDRAPRHRPDCGGDGRICDQAAHDMGIPLDELTGNTPRCEINGFDYQFMGRKEFCRIANPNMRADQVLALLRSDLPKTEIMAKIGTRGFVECALVYEQLKGVPVSSLADVRRRGEIPLLVLDIQGVRLFRETQGPQRVITLALIPPSLDVVRDRMLKRDPGLSAHECERRLEIADREIREILVGHEFDHTIVNHDGRIEETIAQVRAALDEGIARRQGPPITRGLH